jgi:hypothetical protein
MACHLWNYRTAKARIALKMATRRLICQMGVDGDILWGLQFREAFKPDEVGHGT